jgi:hypothetical protein
MFGWLKRRIQMAVVNSFDQDIDRFISGLKGAGDSEVGAIVACATHWRNVLEAQFGWDLDHPDLVVAAQDIGAAMKLNRMIREVQQSEPAMAVGLMVWLHSVRASQTPEIRLRGREMWAELERGIPHAYDGAEGFRIVGGMNLNIEGVERIPENLAPAGGSNRVAAMASVIHEMSCDAHHLRDTLGAPLHRYFTRHPMLRGHRAPAPGAQPQVHVFQLNDGRQGFNVMVCDGDQGGKAWLAVTPDGDFEGANVQSSRKGQYIVRVERYMARHQGRLATKLVDVFVTTYDAANAGV